MSIPTDGDKEKNAVKLTEDQKVQNEKLKKAKEAAQAEIADDFRLFIDSDSYKKIMESGSVTLGQIYSAFVEYMERNGKSNSLEIMKKFLRREVVWDDIKDMELKASTTIDREISDQIFQKQGKDKQRAGALVYFDKFKQNIKELKGGQFDSFKREWNIYLGKNSIKDPKSMEKIGHFKNITSTANFIMSFLKTLPDDVKNSIKESELMDINIKNKEIMDKLVFLGVINDDTKKAIEQAKDLTEINFNKDLNNVKKFFEGLVQAQLVGEINDDHERSYEYINKMYEANSLPKLGNLLNKYGVPDQKWLEDAKKKNDDYKKLLEENPTANQDQKDIFLRLCYIKSKDNKIGSALISLHKKGYDINELSPEDRKPLMENLFANYKEQYYKAFATLFDMKKPDKKIKFENAFDQIFTNELFTNKKDETHIVLQTDSGTTTIKAIREINVADNISKPGNMLDLAEFGFDFDFDLTPDGESARYFDELMKSDRSENYKFSFNFGGETFNYMQPIRITDKTKGITIEGYPSHEESGQELIIKDKKGEELLMIKAEDFGKYDIDSSYMPKYDFGGEHRNMFMLFTLLSLSTQDNPRQNPDEMILGAKKSKKQIAAENARLSAQEREKKKSDMLKQFDSLDGDKSAKFAEDTVIYIKEGDLDSQIPWGGGKWIKMEIKPAANDNDPNNLLARVTLTYVDFAKDSAQTEVEFTADMMRKLKSDCFNSLCKFKQKDSLKDFFDYIQSVNISKNYNPDIANFTPWKTAAGLSVDVEGNKLMKQEDNKKEEIQYIGKITNRKETTKEGDPDYKDNEKVTGVFFKVKFEGKKVKIDYIHEGYSETMDYTSFMLFISDKGLSPFTETEYKKTQNSIDDTNNDSAKAKTPFTMVSIGGLIKAFKKIPEKMKYYAEQREKLDSIRAYGYIVKSTSLLGYLPFMKDFKNLKNDYLSESDNIVWSLISKHKDTLMREGSGGGVHAKRIAEVIKNSIFEKMDSWLIGDNRDFQYKACGYLLYSLQIGGDAYFRATAKYGGKGYWVKAILGAQHQQRFLAKYQAMQNMLKNDPTNSKLIHQIAQAEMLYLVEQTGKDPKFGSTFGTTLEGLMIGLGDKVNVSKTNDSKKATFEEGGYPHFLGMNRNPEAVGSLQAMMEKVDSHTRYKQMFMYMFVPVLSGHAKNSWTDPTHTGFKKLGRTFGYPLALFSEDRYGGVKIARILDYISTKIGLGGNESFTKATGWSIDKIRPDNYMDNFGDFFKKMQSWWEKYGDKVINVLNYNSPELLSYGQDFKQDNIDKDTYDAISEYINDKVNMSAREKWTNYGGDAIFQSAEINPSFRNNILNMPAGVVEHKMLHFQHGIFKDDLAESLWESVKGKIEQFNHSEVDSNIVGFMLKKYNTWFKHTYRDNMKYLVSAIHRVKQEPVKANEYLQKFVSDHLKYEKGEIHVPGLVNDVMSLFQEFITKNLDKIDDKVIADSFGEEYKNSFSFSSYKELDEKIKNMETSPKMASNKGKDKGQQDEYGMAA